MAAISFGVSFTGEIDNLMINNYKACQTQLLIVVNFTIINYEAYQT